MVTFICSEAVNNGRVSPFTVCVCVCTCIADDSFIGWATGAVGLHRWSCVKGKVWPHYWKCCYFITCSAKGLPLWVKILFVGDFGCLTFFTRVCVCVCVSIYIVLIT